MTMRRGETYTMTCETCGMSQELVYERGSLRRFCSPCMKKRQFDQDNCNR